jgi:hypothetical protein
VDFIFGYTASAWSEYFKKMGHEVTCVNVSFYGEDHDQYQQNAVVDVNFIIGCPILFQIIAQCGYPTSGRNILWVLDPLTHQSSFHADKVQSLEAMENRFDAIACMDSQIKAYFQNHCSAIPLIEMPYVLDEKRILEPMPENQKLIDILMLGRRTPRRDRVVESLHAAGLNVNYMHHSCWGSKRQRALRNTKLCLQVSMDEHIYFDQYRIFEAYAHGAMVIGHEMPDMKKYGFYNGKNIVTCDVEDIPQHCIKLLEDDHCRMQIIESTQNLIRQNYTVEKLGADMLALFKKIL